MEDINKSNKQPESPSDNEEDIIDLVDVVSSDSIDDDIDHAFDSILAENDGDDDIIELTDRVEPPPGTPTGEEDAIIDLVDIVTPEDAQPIDLKLDDATEDAIIDLTEIVDIPGDTTTDADHTIGFDEAADLNEQDEHVPASVLPVDAMPDEDVEEVIELNDQLDPPVSEETEEDDYIEIVDSEPMDYEPVSNDDTIEMVVEEPAPDDTDSFDIEMIDELVADKNEEVALSDAFADMPAAAEPAFIGADDEKTTASKTFEDDQSGDEPAEIAPADQEPEQIIQLADVLNSTQADGLVEDEVRLDFDEDLETGEEFPESDDTARVLGIKLDDIQAQQSPALTDREIDDAVERIIQRKYGATIEDLIAKAVEKAVSREIESLKRFIMDNDTE